MAWPSLPERPQQLHQSRGPLQLGGPALDHQLKTPQHQGGPGEGLKAMQGGFGLTGEGKGGFLVGKVDRKEGSVSAPAMGRPLRHRR